jgi:hypothetical protein
LTDHIADNLSLKALLPELIERAYGSAIIEAEAETSLPESSFPAICPWSFEQLMDAGFWPD